MTGAREAGPVEVKTLKRPWELGLALPPAMGVTFTSPPTPEQREELCMGMEPGVWRVPGKRFRHPHLVPRGRKNTERVARGPGSKSRSTPTITKK